MNQIVESHITSIVDKETANIDPIDGSEFQKLADDALAGIKYSFLAAAASQETPFPANSVEESLRQAIATRKPEQRLAYKNKAMEITRQAAPARQALLGRYGNFTVEEYGRMGFLGSSSRLPALALDSAKLKATVDQILREVDTDLAPEGSSAVGIHPLSGSSPAPSVKSVGFYITQVKCIDETNPEVGHDEISLGGLVIGETGNTAKIKPFQVSEYFLDDAGEETYPNVKHDVTTVNFPDPGHLFHKFDTTKSDSWPKNFAAVLFISEEDAGGFANFGGRSVLLSERFSVRFLHGWWMLWSAGLSTSLRMMSRIPEQAT
jgi:hypothetical protein